MKHISGHIGSDEKGNLCFSSETTSRAGSGSLAQSGDGSRSVAFENETLSLRRWRPSGLHIACKKRIYFLRSQKPKRKRSCNNVLRVHAKARKLPDKTTLFHNITYKTRCFRRGQV